MKSLPALALFLLFQSCITMLFPKLTTKTKEEFAEFKKEHLEGYKANSSQSFRGKMADAAPAQFSIPPKTCARVLFELDAGAQYRQDITYILFEKGNGRPGGSTEAPPGIYGPGGVARLGCFRNGANMTVVGRAPDMSNVLGTGGYKMQAYFKPATDEELEKAENEVIAVQNNIQRAQERENAQNAKVGAICDICKTQWNNCMATQNNQSACGNEYNMCTFKRLNGRPGCPKM